MKPLQGIKVVELGTHVAVPTAARLLADWGAEVIKIEAAAGDPWRTHGLWNNLPIEDDCNPAFAANNSGKRFVSLDLKNPEGKAALLRILADADVFMTNIRWGGIQRLGLDYDTLHEMYPSLVYCHFTGYGYEGPDKDKPGYDMTAFWAKSGSAHEFHEAGQPPIVFPGGYGDAASSNSLLSGIVAALYHREKTGVGLRLSTSLYANGIWCNFSRVVACQEREDGSIPPVFPAPPERQLNPVGLSYECKDGEWIKFSAGYARYAISLMRAVGLGEYAEDERFVPSPEIPKEPHLLKKLLADAFKTKTSAEWDPILMELDIPFQRLLHSGEVAKDEQAWANGYVGTLVCPNGKKYVLPNSPVTFFGADPIQSTHAGGIGCDTSAVLTECGYSNEEIQSLLDRGIASGK